MKHVKQAILFHLFISLAACEGDTAPGTPSVTLEPGSYMAVVTTDYSVSAVGVLNRANGELVSEAVLSSSTNSPEITLPLSGDVALPSDPPPPGILFVIDRGGSNNNINVLETTHMTVLAQIPVGTSTLGPWYANPHDTLLVNDSRLYVTRYQANPSPSAGAVDMDEGDDIVIVDTTTLQIVKQIRFNSILDPWSGERANPDRIVRAGSYVVSTLGHFTNPSFSAAGNGLVAVIDTATETLVDTDPGSEGTQLIEIAEFKSCGPVQYLTDELAVYVACSGVFADGRDTQIERSGVVRIDLTPLPGDAAEYTVVLEGGNDEIGQPVSNLLVVDAETAFVLTYGNFFDPFESDQLIRFNPSEPEAAPELIFSASGPFQLGSISYDASTQVLYVTDTPFGGDPLIRRFQLGIEVTELEGINPSPGNGLAPTALGQFEVE